VKENPFVPIGICTTWLHINFAIFIVLKD
jgi:hypothetical protein